MNNQEASTVLEIMMEADGGCYICAYYLVKEFAEKFPEFDALAKTVYLSDGWKREYDREKDQKSWDELRPD